MPVALPNQHDTGSAEVQALVELQRQHGLATRVRAIGRNAVKVAALMGSMVAAESSAGGSERFAAGCVTTVVIFDRETDLVTPLLSQFTAEGLLDDAYGLAAEGGYLQPKTGTSALPPPPPHPLPHPLTRHSVEQQL